MPSWGEAHVIEQRRRIRRCRCAGCVPSRGSAVRRSGG